MRYLRWWIARWLYARGEWVISDLLAGFTDDDFACIGFTREAYYQLPEAE